MQTIRTRLNASRDTITASTEGKPSKSYPVSSDLHESHREAFRAYAASFGWSGEVVGGVSNTEAVFFTPGPGAKRIDQKD